MSIADTVILKLSNLVYIFPIHSQILTRPMISIFRSFILRFADAIGLGNPWQRK